MRVRLAEQAVDLPSSSSDEDPDYVVTVEAALDVDTATSSGEDDAPQPAGEPAGGAESSAGEEDEDEDEDSALDSDGEGDVYLRSRNLRGFHARQLAGCRRLSAVKAEPLAGDLALQLRRAVAAASLRRSHWAGKHALAHEDGRPNLPPTPAMLRARESGDAGACGAGGAGGGFSAAQRVNLGGCRHRPHRPVQLVDRMQSRAYIGQFDKTGETFVAAFQHERRIRLYDTQRGWRIRKDIHARNLRWTVTDTALSPDQKFLVYASITPTVHLVNVGANPDEVWSQANVTDIHEALHLDYAGPDPAGGGRGLYAASFGVWSLRWTGDGRELVAGCGADSLVVYDLEAQRTTKRIHAHSEDVNAVALADESSNVIISGSDDALIKVWDRRALGSGSSARPVGVLVGHTEGLTHIDAKGDGRHLISNAKDQTIRLWDLRRALAPGQLQRLPKAPVPTFQWDYRWMQYPARFHEVKHPHDCSVMTYRGHQTLQTLIRAYWSPAHTTGQRFIYVGSKCGSVFIYDVVTGQQVDRLRYHQEIVRDCSWHPYEPTLVTTAFDGTVIRWEPEAGGGGRQGEEEGGAKARGLPDPATRGDMFDPYF